jgi:hypothetical protein
VSARGREENDSAADEPSQTESLQMNDSFSHRESRDKRLKLGSLQLGILTPMRLILMCILFAAGLFFALCWR